MNDFLSAIKAHGLNPPTNIEPGRFCRFPGDGKSNGNKAGWCKLFPDGQGGVFGDFSSGLTETWQADDDRKNDPAMREIFRQQIEEVKKQSKFEQQAKHGEAAKKASRIWQKAKPAPADHPYLHIKSVKPHGIRILGKSLLIPVRNSITGELQSIQFINPDGRKRFLSGGVISGGYHPIGKPDNTLLIAEGYATAATLHEVTSHAVAVAFNAGNLLPVAEALREKYPKHKIIICGDNDMQTEGNPGLKKATEASSAVGAWLAIPQFKDTNSGTDFNDLAINEGLAVVKHQVESAKIIQEEDTEHTRKSLVVVSLVEFLQQEHPPRINILSPWMPEQGLCMLHAWRGVGKTHISCGIACAVAAGDKFLNWEAPEPSGVLLIDGEMPAQKLQERLQRIILGMDKQPTASVKIITPDNQLAGMPDLGTQQGQLLVEEHITEDIKLIIVDNLSTLVRTGRENDADGWLPVQGWFLKLRAAGKSVLAIHHSNKSGKSRGTSKREDVLDTVIRLEHPKGYTPEQGACFEVHFEKNRGIYGDDVKPFEAKLTEGSNSEAIWSTRTLEDSTYDKVVRLANEGFSKSEIASELEIHRSTAGRHFNKGISNGDIRNE